MEGQGRSTSHHHQCLGISISHLLHRPLGEALCREVQAGHGPIGSKSLGQGLTRRCDTGAVKDRSGV